MNVRRGNLVALIAKHFLSSLSPLPIQAFSNITRIGVPVSDTHQQRTLVLLAAFATWFFYLPELSAATHYVSPTGGNVSPYATWETAAMVIQDAIDAATDGDTVLVTNGVYATGGRAVSGLMTNRVAINKALLVQSVNGSQVTTIQGNGPLGNGAVRCVYVGANARLSGFTLTNGHTRITGNNYERSGGGAWCEVSGVLSNCWLLGNSAQENGGGSVQGILNNCTFTSNSATSGGGSYGGTLNNCTLNNNSASDSGGGSFQGTLNNCALAENSAIWGGGISYGTLTNCNLTGNSTFSPEEYAYAIGGGGGSLGGTLYKCDLTRNSSANNGGGAAGCTLINCSLIENSAGHDAFSSGGGSYGCTLINCEVTGNVAISGGGSSGGMLNNCTLTGNSASLFGGGSCSNVLNNCIVYHNTAFVAGPNHYGAELNYSCTSPLPSEGTNNIGNDPLLASASHLSAGSPCIGAGSASYTGEVDIDGEPWRNPPCMGVDQYVVGSVTGALTMTILKSYTNVVAGYPVNFVAQNRGRINASAWKFGDGTEATNQPYISHSWSNPGTYTVRLTGYNDTYPGGVITSMVVQVADPVIYYVSANNPTAQHPYTNWQTAATNIQAAIDAGTAPGRLVLVTNGIYDSGGVAIHGLMTNRIAVPEGVWVRSVNGAQVTRIVGAPAPSTGGDGDSAIRCAYLGVNAILSGFTLTNGHTRASGDLNQEQGGGGVWCEAGGVVSNCWIFGNSARYAGGGSYRGMLNNCSLTNNSATYAGGAAGSTLNDCTLTDGFAHHGGGTYWCSLSNCVLTGNYATNAGGGDYGSTLNNCVIAGNSAGGVGGGSHLGMLNNCTVTRNTASLAGGVNRGTLNNCTVTRNAAINASGGVNGGTLNNCIVYYNSASQDENYDGFNESLAYCCTTPLPIGQGNITFPPAFKDFAGDDYRLAPGSPCIDAGLNQAWMFTAKDLDGNARIFNGTVDMGAYETPFVLNLRVLLQGPYDTNTHSMRVGNLASIPLTSPFAADPRMVTSLPPGIVDWVLIELRKTNGNEVIAKSAFLDTQGQLLAVDGSPGFRAEVTAGSYTLVVKQRNHLAAMSAQPLAFTNYLVVYDFTTGADKYSGGSNAAVQLESGAWGMISGDADGDGTIQSADGTIYASQSGQAGYNRADFDLDGIVSSNDLALLTANQSRSSGATDPETSLLPILSIRPIRQTVLGGATVTLTASGTTNAVNWVFATNASGGTLVPLTAASAIYTAGPGSNAVDIVEAWDGNRLGRAWVNVISAADVTRVGKAIVIAGRRSNDDPVWPTTDYLGNLAYNSLLYRGFAKNNVQYLSPVTSEDVDGNGTLDDVALASTFTNAALTFTNWAMSNPSQLFVYLVDHGGLSSGAGYFRLNAGEVLTASDLNGWLNAIQTRYGIDVVVVLDFCDSGSFLDPLKHSGPGKRTVISACDTNEPTYYLAGGQVSFSDAFFGALLTGLDLGQAFSLAQGAMSTYQSALADANGDGLYGVGTDPALMGGTSVGASFIAGKDIPQIGHVMGDQALAGSTEATLWAYDIASAYPLRRVWCLVVPPSHHPNPTNPVADLPLLELAYNTDTDRYEAEYSGFSEVGTYKLVYYAQDIWDSVSLPKQSYVFQNGFQERVILVAGGNTNAATWPAVDNMARLAYNAFRSRRVDPQSIYYLSPVAAEDVDHNGTNDVAASSSLTNLSYAITNWALGADKVTVYLVGEGTNGQFRLTSTQILAPADLKSWLDVYQASNGQAQVVMDFSGSGAFIPVLKAGSSGLVRICVASAQANKPSLFANGGIVSFSQFFLSDLFNGDSIGQAFAVARDSIKLASGGLKQTAALDDNGDGIPNKFDGALAATHYIGSAFRTGGDPPVIGSVMSNAVLALGQSLVIWVKDVTAVEGISNVWCVITAPDYDGTSDLPQFDLSWNPETMRYEVVCTNFTTLGTYGCTFYARDNTGVLSNPEQCEVTVADPYEADDTADQATIFTVSVMEQHNFHSATDEDWVKFYAPTGLVYNIDATQLSTNSDLRLALYYEQEDGALAFVDFVDDYASGEDETESLTLDLKTGQSGLSPGVYYVRVSSADTNLFGDGSDYRLEIYPPIGGSGGVVLLDNPGNLFPMGSFYVYMGPPDALAGGAGWRVMELTNQTYYYDTTNYVLPVPSGTNHYNLTYRAVPGFAAPTNAPLPLIADATTSMFVYYTYTNLSPRAKSSGVGTNGVFSITYVGKAGKRYAIEESTNLFSWKPLVTNQIPQDGLLRFTTTNSPAKTRAFYRAHLVP